MHHKKIHITKELATELQVILQIHANQNFKLATDFAGQAICRAYRSEGKRAQELADGMAEAIKALHP